VSRKVPSFHWPYPAAALEAPSKVREHEGSRPRLPPRLSARLPYSQDLPDLPDIFQPKFQEATGARVQLFTSRLP